MILLLAYYYTYVSEQVDEVAVVVAVAAVPLAADDLQQQHAEAVHVRFHREDALGSVLGSHVATVVDMSKRNVSRCRKKKNTTSQMNIT